MADRNRLESGRWQRCQPRVRIPPPLRRDRRGVYGPRSGLLRPAELELDLVPQQVAPALEVVLDVDEQPAAARRGRDRSRVRCGRARPSAATRRSSSVRSRSTPRLAGGQPPVVRRGRLGDEHGRGRSASSRRAASASSRAVAAGGRGRVGAGRGAAQRGSWWPPKGVRPGGNFECRPRRPAGHKPRRRPVSAMRENRGHVVRISARAGPGRPAGGTAAGRARPGWSCSTTARSWRSSAARPGVLLVVGWPSALVAVLALARPRCGDPGRRARRGRLPGPDGPRRRGPKAARWRDVEDAVAASPHGVDCVVLRLRDGRTTSIPVAAVDAAREDFVAGPARPPAAGPGAAAALTASRRVPDSARSAATV